MATIGSATATTSVKNNDMNLLDAASLYTSCMDAFSDWDHKLIVRKDRRKLIINDNFKRARKEAGKLIWGTMSALTERGDGKITKSLRIVTKRVADCIFCPKYQGTKISYRWQLLEELWPFRFLDYFNERSSSTLARIFNVHNNCISNSNSGLSDGFLWPSSGISYKCLHPLTTGTLNYNPYDGSSC